MVKAAKVKATKLVSMREAAAILTAKLGPGWAYGSLRSRILNGEWQPGREYHDLRQAGRVKPAYRINVDLVLEQAGVEP